MHVPAQGDIDWWAEQGSKQDMLKMMSHGHHIRYHAYKELEFEDALPERAFLTAESLKSGGWSLATHNCVHQAYLVFSDYSREHKLPNPFEDPINLIPKKWFARIPANPLSL